MANEEQSTLEDIAEILTLFSKGQKVLGSKEKFKDAVSRLIVSSEVTVKNYESLINYILDCVIHEWRKHKIKKEDLLKPNKRGEVMIAKKMAILLVKQQIEIGNEELSRYFGTSTRQTIHKIMQEYSCMNKKYNEHATFIERYERIQVKVLTFIKSLK